MRGEDVAERMAGVVTETERLAIKSICVAACVLWLLLAAVAAIYVVP